MFSLPWNECPAVNGLDNFSRVFQGLFPMKQLQISKHTYGVSTNTINSVAREEHTQCFQSTLQEEKNTVLAF